MLGITCPACHPSMLEVSADGNRKAYRFKKSKGFVLIQSLLLLLLIIIIIMI